MATQNDSIPRINVRDLFIALKLFEAEPSITLESLRLRLCQDAKVKRKGDYLFPKAVTVANELQKLRLVEAGPMPKATTRTHEASKNKCIRVSEPGKNFLATFLRDRGTGFDQLFAKMYTAHRPLRLFAGVVADRILMAPIATSVKEHVGASYSSAAVLANAVACGKFDASEPLQLLSQRLQRELTEDERGTIREGIGRLAKESKLSAESEEPTEFAKNFLSRFNDIVLPAVFSGDGLTFDFRTHRALWGWGEEFNLWGTITSHPKHDGTVIYRTATIQLSDDRETVSGIAFDAGPKKTGENFLAKLYAAYQKLQEIRKTNHVLAWELRSVFCLDNRCQQSVFNTLFKEKYTGDDVYKLHFEIQQQKPRHEEPVRAGKRAIGSVLITRGGRP
jgi:hypothetical protein